jgi:hypothetical protein
MACRVRESILDDFRCAGYFSLSVDSTPDGSHIERFLTFLEMGSHTGESMAKMVQNYLTNECKIDFSKCRGQSYDKCCQYIWKIQG